MGFDPYFKSTSKGDMDEVDAPSESGVANSTTAAVAAATEADDEDDDMEDEDDGMHFMLE
jgi:hypothetical protein